MKNKMQGNKAMMARSGVVGARVFALHSADDGEAREEDIETNRKLHEQA